jgi:hypothetical protein
MKTIWALLAVLVIAYVILTSGCAYSGLYQMSDEWCAVHPSADAHRCASVVLSKATTYCQYGEHPGDAACTSGQSWDQENLKRNDRGCPTAIYTAPNGNLELCHP